MSNYAQTAFFTPKDALPAGNPAKTIYGAAFDVEFGNIATAVTSKLDAASAVTLSGNQTFTGVNLFQTASGVSLTARGDGTLPAFKSFAGAAQRAGIFDSTSAFGSI